MNFSFEHSFAETNLLHVSLIALHFRYCLFINTYLLTFFKSIYVIRFFLSTDFVIFLDNNYTQPSKTATVLSRWSHRYLGHMKNYLC